MSSVTAEGVHSKESMLEQVNDIEPLEQINHIECNIIENAQRELGTSVSSILSEQLQPLSENVANDSLPQLSEQHSFPQLTTSEKAGDFGRDVCIEPLGHQPGRRDLSQRDSRDVRGKPHGQKHQPNTKYVGNEAPDSSILGKHLESFSGNATNDPLIKNMDLLQEDVSMSCQTEKTSCPQQETSELKNECGAGSQCTEPSKQNLHVGSNLLHKETGENNTITFVVAEQHESISENRTMICDGKLVVSEGVIKNCQTDKKSCPQQSMLGQTKNYDCGCALGEKLKSEDNLGSEHLHTSPVKTSNAASDPIAAEHLEPPLGDVSGNPIISKQQEQSSEDVVEKSTLEQFETSSKSLRKNSSKSGRKVKRTSKSRQKKYMLRSLVGSDRLLRSRTQEKPKSLEPSNILGNANAGNGVEKKKERKKRGAKKVIADEFSRIRKRLRYFLNRIQYEQNLIDAYSSEGWKGNSLEKLKPEKELQRATSEIFRRKLKIRDLFQQLDSLCAEGRFPKGLFDSEGQIDSEDIFCAKCGSKDLSADNDIILCDGACDRGFHQFCLEPPLLNEDIPPDNEGWLCPGCDCKVDCVDLLNDSHETNLSVGDNWEKVFPEAAAAVREGNNLDHNPELPSDDSEDDDYDPDGQEIEEKIDTDDSSSDESEYASACDELEAPPNNEMSLRLSSDDSDDNDYDPNALDIDENVKQESSSSDFTSDSEDLAATVDDNNAKRLLGKSNKQGFKCGGNKSSLKGELLDILNSGPGEDGSSLISEKRHVSRLDYKRLHDEAYGNVPSESSDDEDWSSSAATRKRKKKTTEQVAPMLSSDSRDDEELNNSSTTRKRKKKATGQVAPRLPNGNASTEKSEATKEPINHNLENREHISRRRPRQKSMVKDANDSPSKSLVGSPKSASTGSRVKSTSYKRLGDAVTQRLYTSFKENQYPDRAMKQSLAEELGLDSRQVSKWFENMRWSVRHSTCKEAGISGSASERSVPSPQTDKQLLESKQNIEASNGELPGIVDALPKTCTRKQDDDKAKLHTNESSCHTSAAQTSGRKRGRPKIEKPTTPVLVDANKTSGTRTRSRRKSAP
ncbi:homeobox protein HAT3.1 [Humulus lupulus]|uniref:homeobox protein HAT3.1 n=1 Tax=Humulus lupulus TaxID=3486 RepID=UPI002B408C7A|nr:homeobox protein HAT3.1 [Humulus lupulus]